MWRRQVCANRPPVSACSTTTNPSACSTRLIIDPGAGCKIVGSIPGLGPRYTDTFGRKKDNTRHATSYSADMFVMTNACTCQNKRKRPVHVAGARGKAEDLGDNISSCVVIAVLGRGARGTANPRNIKWWPSTPRSAAPEWHRGA